MDLATRIEAELEDTNSVVLDTRVFPQVAGEREGRAGDNGERSKLLPRVQC